jgi:hypothetical protein
VSSDASAQLVSSYEGAAAVARDYPAHADTIVTAAAEAFSHGKSLAIGVALVLTLGGLLLVVLRYPRKDDEEAYYERVAAEQTATAS